MYKLSIHSKFWKFIVEAFLRQDEETPRKLCKQSATQIQSNFMKNFFNTSISGYPALEISQISGIRPKKYPAQP